MWIRSQGRKILSNVNNLYVRVIGKGYEISSDKCDLGKYSTEQKALNVMDMIQNAITGTRFDFTDIVRDCDLAGIEIHNVFNMPKDDEVKA